MKNSLKMKKISLAVAFCMIFSLVLQVNMNTVFAADSEKVINVLTFNDFHGSVQSAGKDSGAAKLVGEINKFKSENPNTIVVAGGDLFQGSAMSNLTYGAPVAEMLSLAGVKYSAVGNHEFDWGLDKFAGWEEKGNFSFLASNIYDKSTNAPVSWAKPYAIEEIDGVKIGFIGLTTPETATATAAANVATINFEDPVTVASGLAKKLKEEEKVNVVIALTHMASSQSGDGSITGEAVELTNVKGIDAVVSSHSHLKVCGKVNNIPVIQAMKNGRALAGLQIKMNADKTINSIEPSIDVLYERADTLVSDTNAENMVNRYNQELQPILGEKVAELQVDLPHNRENGLSPLGEFTSKYLAKIAGTEICIMNGGGIRDSLNKGTITMGDMYKIFPFDNTLVKMELKGSDLKKAIENGIAPADYGWGQFYGLKVYYDKDKEFGNRITYMETLNGEPIDMEKYYSVATNDFMFTGGDKYDFSGAINYVDTMIPLRDALVDEFKKEGTLTHTYTNALVQGPKPETKPEVKPEEKPEVKPETKPEVKPQVKPNTDKKPSNNKKTSSDKLPQTGQKHGTNDMVATGTGLIIIAGMIYAIGKKKNENDAA